MGNDEVIVAIELGSSKISGVAGQIMSDGSIKVLAYAGVPSSACIRHGAVYNLDKTANAIADVVCRLESILAAKIERVYVGYNAKGLRSVLSRVVHEFEEETVVSQEVIDVMFQQCSAIEYEGFVNLFQESQEYVVDSKRETETDPMGVACRSLEGNYLNILLKKQVADYIGQCFMAAQIDIVDGYVSPMVQADAVLTKDDRQQGCALVDYGADTTTVSVYKNGLLRYLRVIPLGSALITRDLATILKIEPDEAERLKCTYGLCNLIGKQDSDETILVNGNKVSLKEIGEIMEARNEEIIRNVFAQIKLSGYSDVLYAGIILTGGGSQLRQLDQVFMKPPFMRKPRIATEPLCGVNWVEPRWKLGDGSQLALLSVMLKGDESCCELPKMDAFDNVTPEEEANVVQQSLFTESGESAQEERDRKEQEDRKQAEEAAARKEEEKAKEAEAEKSGKKRNSVFKRWYDNLINMSETFFDEKDEKEQNSVKETAQTDENKQNGVQL